MAKQAAKRIYVVTENGKGSKRLVRAVSPASAIRHCAQSQFCATPAKVEDVIGMDKSAVEEAGAEPAQA
jgi:hypothetical protein